LSSTTLTAASLPAPALLLLHAPKENILAFFFAGWLLVRGVFSLRRSERALVEVWFKQRALLRVRGVGHAQFLVSFLSRARARGP
jgi:hypothetical protein